MPRRNSGAGAHRGSAKWATESSLSGTGELPLAAQSSTHGTSEERVSWLKKGLDTGDLNACDTFGEGHVGPAKMMGSGSSTL
jgi:hypothetical protein